MKPRGSEAAKQRSSATAKQRSSEAVKQRPSDAAKYRGREERGSEAARQQPGLGQIHFNKARHLAVTQPVLHSACAADVSLA